TRVHVPPEEIETIRETLGRRRHFIRIRTMEVNAVKRLLRSSGLPAVRSLSGVKAWEKLLKEVAISPSLHAFVSAHYAVWTTAQEQIAALIESLEVQGKPYRQELDRLQTVPGVGPIVAMTMMATICDGSRFPSAKPVARYV